VRAAVPVIAGAAVFAGAAAATGPIAAENAASVPSTLVAVTLMRRLAPSSALTSV
jgi:hypothetical protein